jgi:uncharacterized damage-inducible protein DinB
MDYPFVALRADAVPRAAMPFAQHMLDTYASETNKVASVWHAFTDDDLRYRPHPRAMCVADVLKHQLLSERRFFGEFLQIDEPAASTVLPQESGVSAHVARLVDLARPRLSALAGRDERWWLETAPFFDVERQRAWIFWRRVLHSTHHRTQLTVYLRLLDRPVPSTYGPTADVSWEGADPTNTVDAARRK